MSEASRGIRRVDTLRDLPDESVRCLAMGRHVGFGVDDPSLKKSSDWPASFDAFDVRHSCDCGRWRRQTIDVETGEVLSRSPDYGGGVALWSKSTPTRDEARAEYLRRVRERATRAERERRASVVAK